MAPTPRARPAPSTLSRSRAFRQASLRSERRRVYAVIGTAALLIIFALLPGATRRVDPAVQIVASLGLGCLVALQLGILALAYRAERRDRPIPIAIIVAALVVECLIPGGIIFWHLLHRSFPPYSALGSPPILAYGLLICLTTLRLRPWLCILAGAVCAGSLAAMTVYVRYGLGIAQPSTGLPPAAYTNAALIIFICGLGAAWVAREIRTHLEAALTEADTKLQLARIEQDLSVARTIQRALLPRAAPDLPGFDIAGWNRSADQTGGDYYDWQALPDGNWIITLADVSGHGIGPALVTAACRAYARASSFYNADLASLASHMNRLLADDLPDGRFVTMASVLIDPRGGPLRLLSAGHGPIVLYIGATGTTQDILPQDLPLAVIPDSSFGPATPITLGRGDLLALITDGFVEWSRPGENGRREQFGLARLRDSLTRHAALPAAAMIQAVAADVASFAEGHPQQDDLTMVIIKRTAAPS